MPKDIIKKFNFPAEEREKLRDLTAAITVSEQQIDGMQVMKNYILGAVYNRLGIAGDPRKGYSKSIKYNLGANEIIYTESPVKEEPKKDEAKKEKEPLAKK